MQSAPSFLVFVVFTTLAAAGCSFDPVDSIRGAFEEDAQADLRLALPQGAALTCDPGPSVVVTVENRGGAEASESITTVVFVPGGSVDVRTPELGQNESVQLDPVSVPADCFVPSCRFAVLADASFLVDESDENNNRRDGDCPSSAAPVP